MSEMQLLKLEKQIIGKINGVKNNTISPKESGIGSLLMRLKPLDEALYLQLIERYKKVLNEK
jgi:hypothetical protein